MRLPSNELLDLKFGKCRVCMASVNGYKEDIERRLRVATKYVNISKNYFNSINRDVEIIKLHMLTNLTENEISNKKDYFTIMNENIELLRKNLYN